MLNICYKPFPAMLTGGIEKAMGDP